MFAYPGSLEVFYAQNNIELTNLDNLRCIQNLYKLIQMNLILNKFNSIPILYEWFRIFLHYEKI